MSLHDHPPAVHRSNSFAISNEVRCSIIVPIHGEVSAFENTLISVLESRPNDCEIIVAHDGSYDDPFALCDEVRFAIAQSDQFADLVEAGVRLSTARFVHVLSPGLQAEIGWTEAGLQKFEHDDCGSVACVIRNANDHRIVSAGWQPSAAYGVANACEGNRSTTTEAARMTGAHLHASFWRRELLLSLGEAFQSGTSELLTSVAYENLARNAGWRCVLASDCEVSAEHHAGSFDRRGFAVARDLVQLRRYFSTSRLTKFTSIVRSTVNLVGSIAKPADWLSSIGQLTGACSGETIADRINENAVLVYGSDDQVIKLPMSEQTPATNVDRSRHAA